MKGNVEAATQAFRRAIELRPDHSRAHNSLGALLNEQGKEQEAITEYRLAIQHDPNFASPRFALATLLKNRGDEDSAIEQYRKISQSGDDDYLQRISSKMLRAMGEIP